MTCDTGSSTDKVYGATKGSPSLYAHLSQQTLVSHMMS